MCMTTFYYFVTKIILIPFSFIIKFSLAFDTHTHTYVLVSVTLINTYTDYFIFIALNF